MKIIDWIKTYTPKWIALPSTLLLLILIGMVTIPLDELIPSQVKSLLLTLPFLTITATAILMLIAMSFCYLLLYKEHFKKPNMKNYSFIDPPGYYSHKKHGGKFCQHCLLTEPYIESPLHIDVNYLKCNVCDKSIDNPDYKPSPMSESKNLGPYGYLAK